jgi:hypothetical protein
VNTKLVNSAAGVINAALMQDRTAAGIALSLESARMLMSPETAAELVALRDRVAELEAQAQKGEQPADTYPPVLPWAALMDREDLTDFLDELAASAITHASSEVALAEVEETCSTWRLIAEAQHGHNTAPGPDAPTQALRDLRVDGEHYALVHHVYRTPRDLPEPGGAR